MSHTKSIDKPLNTASILDGVLEGRALLPKETLHLLALTQSDDLGLLRQAAQTMAQQQTPKPALPHFSCSLLLTNLCELQPSIYPYPKQPGQTGAYTLTIDDIDAVLELCQTQNNPSLMVSGGGFWSALSIPGLEKPTILKTYGHLLSHIREKCPNISITGFSPDEVEFLSIVSNHTPRYILEFLKDHGLKSLGYHQTGLLVTAVRKKISPKLMPVKEWLELVQTATQLKIPTLLNSELGHLETLADRVQHLLRVQEFLQMQVQESETPLFSKLMPQLLKANPTVQEQWPGGKIASSQERFKWLAVSRLMLGKWIPVQQGFWQVESSDPLDEATEGLTWGANTLGDTNALAYSGFLLDSQPRNWLFPPFTQGELQRRQTEAFDIPRQSH